MQQRSHTHRELELMLRIERTHRPLVEEALGTTVWSENDLGASGAATRCAACGDPDAHADPRCGGIPFCDDCLDRGHAPFTEWDDLGVGD